MYTNIDSLYNKLDLLKCTLYNMEHIPNIIILTEINAKNFKYPVLESELQISGYNLFCKNLSIKSKRGIAIYVDNKLNSLCIDDLIEFNEGLLINITGKNNNLAIFCVYRSPNSNLDNDDKLLKSIQMLSKKYNKNLIIIGDFNYPNIKWNDTPMEKNSQRTKC